MTNAQIIFNESMELLNKGIIKSTGRFFEYEDENGEKQKMYEPEQIHTFAAWKKYGRQVKKGEHAIAKFPIWKQCKSYTTTDKQTGEEVEHEGRMIQKLSFFFTYEQTEPLKEN